MRVILPYVPPYDWTAMSQFLAARATAGVERVDAGGYARSIAVTGVTGSIAVAPMAGADALTVDVAIPDPALIPGIVDIVARMFDVDVNPAHVHERLKGRTYLKRPLAKHPGIRLPGAWNAFELTVRAILGQQVSVRAATTLAGRIAAAWGEPVTTDHGLDRLFPRPASLAHAELERVGLTTARAHTIRTVAQRVCSGTLDLDSAAGLAGLRAISGIGAWTTQYVAMRALKDTDAFPSGDLILRRRAGNCSPRTLELRSQPWRPWRAYAVMLLWSTAAQTTPRRTARLKTARLKTARLKTARLKTARLKTARLKTARLKTARLKTARL